MSSAAAIHTRPNLNTLSLDEKKALMQKTYAETSYFQRLFRQDAIEMECSLISHQLRQEIERILLEKGLIQYPVKLENLHEYLSEEMRAYNFDDGVNKISTYFYETDEAFKTSYLNFVRFLRKNVIKEPFWFQSTPTLRIHCPNAKNSHHYPRYHSDISYGHPPEEINLWFALTDVMEGHGFRRMSVATSQQLLAEFDYDYSAFIHSAIHDKAFSNRCDTLSEPVATPYGKLLAFDSRCIHTGEPLKAHTRISMDIRVLPLSQYQTMEIEYQGSGRRKILFAPGHCYHENNSDYFLNQQGI